MSTHVLTLVSTFMVACAFKGEGVVTKGPVGARVVTSTGTTYKLVVGEDDRALAALDGHVAVLEGRRVGKNLKVSGWYVPSGKHGMNVWIGTLERHGARLGLVDHNTGAWFFLDRDTANALSGSVGEVVLLEGYSEGKQQVKVLHIETLTGQ